jgi:anthranilate phosphoribosyltransferase
MQRQILKLEAGGALEDADIREAAEFLLDGAAADEEKGRFLEALSRKGETPGEIAGFVTTFLGYSVDPGLDGVDLAGPTIDVCGTGGDKLDLFNVSTTAMFVVAAAGAVVVKHGNRGITSKSGGADVLEALGIRIDLPMDRFHVCLAEAGVGFLFAPMMHPAFKAVVGVRKMLAQRGVRTIFNLIGPLLNPARPKCQLVGVFAEDLVPAFAEILARLGRESAWVVHGRTADGRPVDEVSLMGPTRIRVAGQERELLVHPEEFGLARVDPAVLAGGGAKENAAILEAVLSGAERGAKRDMVLLNAGAAITCAGIAPDMARGIVIAREMIDGGAALERLRILQRLAR